MAKKVWRRVKASKNFPCILCGETIISGNFYWRPPLTSLDKFVSSPHKTTWETRPPYFHEDCFLNLQELYDPCFPKEYRDGSGNGWVPYP